MNKRIQLFKRLEIETQSTCNRKCPECIRNSIPDRESVSSWFELNQLSTEDFYRVLNQTIEMGFKGEVCLSHYNEPLMDERIIDLAKETKKLGFSRVFMCSNGDFLTEEIAKGLDGVLDDIGFTLYMEDPQRAKRDTWIKSLFKKTKISVDHAQVRMITHNSPLVDVNSVTKKHQNNPCTLPQVRMIVNHRGQMLMCCDDLVGNFDLGTIHEKSIEQLWYDEKHQNYVIELTKAGGRSIHPHCMSCPRN